MWCVPDRRSSRGFIVVLGFFNGVLEKTWKMATWAIAGRSTSTMVRATWRRAAASVRTTTMPSPPPATSTVRSCSTRTSSFHSQSRLVRRELSSLFPLHTAIASACLVSKIPGEPTTSIEGRFANYLSPI